MGLEPSGWRTLRTVVVGLGMLAGLIGAGLLVLAGLSYVVADAVFERRWPWLTVPATAAGGAFFLWVIGDNERARRRMIGAIRGQVLDCPFCGASLPRWNGSFAWFPPEQEDICWIGLPPEGQFRLRCDRCNHEAWFYAHLDGSVNPHWSPDRPDGIVVNLNEGDV